MADMSAEMAFLQSLQSGEAGAYGEQPQQTAPPVEDDDEEDYDPSNLIPDTTPYDPEAVPEVAPQSPVQPTPSQPASEAPSRVTSANPDAKQQVKPPRTMGGFVVDDEDDEDFDDDDDGIGDSNTGISTTTTTTNTRPINQRNKQTTKIDTNERHSEE